ncbi:NAD(P)H-hydrate dehydratase [Candidatus Peribacteria bacterium]|nr:NAD(P)H-hydrate dehydratase [Candidatus Peribacteria bacterium]
MRSPASHKGENGSVAIIGGSKFQHGAPLFSALAAEASGVDLVFLFVPSCHVEVAKNTSLNFQVHPFGSDSNDEISSRDRARMIEKLATMDSVVIGPGLSRTSENLASILVLLEECPCPLVADASALQEATLAVLQGKHAVVTPHLGELERMGLAMEEVFATAKKHSCTFLIKSKNDTIVDEKGVPKTVLGGNAGLTVGGTGDALAGLTAGLLVQGHPQTDACILASTTIKRAGDMLYEKQGYAYTTREVIALIPAILRDLVS